MKAVANCSASLMFQNLSEVYESTTVFIKKVNNCLVDEKLLMSITYRLSLKHTIISYTYRCLQKFLLLFE